MSASRGNGATRRALGAGRWHFQHGPIDCIVDAEGETSAVEACVECAWVRFETVLDELVAELPLLRADVATPFSSAPGARRMPSCGKATSCMSR